jgi:hypothetical protein
LSWREARGASRKKTGAAGHAIACRSAVALNSRHAIACPTV